jgi:Haem-binding uptake, Tiki superfamily, ChaN
MGLLKTTISGLQLEENMTFRNFFSGRILWDESMATISHSWVENNPGGLLIGLVGADHVKFRDGIPGRFARMAGETGVSCVSVMLNPTLIDTRPSGTVGNSAEATSSQYPDRITLQLRYLKDGVDLQNPSERGLPDNTGGVLPLADFIVIG